MGMYTEFLFTANLHNLPDDVFNVLNYAVSYNTDKEEPVLPKHAFFDTPRWTQVFWGESAYFPAERYARFTKREYINDYTLNIHSSLKNYNDEINLFIDWITPYVSASYLDDVDDKFFVGYERYEENNLPTLLFIDVEKRDII